jgi:aspartyl aminopeptidase
MTIASAQGLVDFIWAAPSPFHCVLESQRMLEAAGFVKLDEKTDEVKLAPGQCGYVHRQGSLIAWRGGTEAPAAAGFRVLGTHTDSPNLRIKPNPDTTKEGWRQLTVAPYGGVLLSTWLDRDLGISGKVVVRHKGDVHTRLFRTDKPVARIPNLAIHLNRTVNDKGLVLNAQKHMTPVVGLGDGPAFGAWLAQQLEVDEVLTWELGLHDLQPPVIGGMDDEFIFAPRLDNLGSTYPAIVAMIEAKTSPSTQVLALFDHEEIGSMTYRGAMGPFLRQWLKRLERNHESQAHGGFERAIANSWMVSADMAHAIHPNHADKHEPDHKPMVNGGPVIKSHVGQRYATDCESSALFSWACHEENVAYQQFVTRNDLRCGSTIGPLTAAKIGIRTVDVGNPMLSMHSCREQAGAHDVAPMAKVMRRVLER